MQSNLSWRTLPHQWRRLKARAITRNSRKLILPQPAQGLLAVLDTREVGCGTAGNGTLFVGAEFVVGLCEARADKEDVACARGEISFLEDLED